MEYDTEISHATSEQLAHDHAVRVKHGEIPPEQEGWPEPDREQRADLDNEQITRVSRIELGPEMDWFTRPTWAGRTFGLFLIAAALAVVFNLEHMAHITFWWHGLALGLLVAALFHIGEELNR